MIQLRPELLRHSGALRLVFGEDFEPELRHPAIPHDAYAHLFFGVEELEDHAREAVEGVGRQTAGGGYALRQRVERPVEERVAVDQVDTHSPDYTEGAGRIPPLSRPNSYAGWIGSKISLSPRAVTTFFNQYRSSK